MQLVKITLKHLQRNEIPDQREPGSNGNESYSTFTRATKLERQYKMQFCFRGGNRLLRIHSAYSMPR